MPPRDAVSNEFRRLIDEFVALRRELIGQATESAEALDEVHPSQRQSALNLLHYLALRGRDLRPLQMRLAALGLSSLGRAESHVLSAVEAVLAVLHRAVGREWQPDDQPQSTLDIESGQRLLDAHTKDVLGSVPADRGVAIMVTMPSEAADDYSLVQHLLEHGMDCMRINCAHDDAAAWGRMLEHLRRAERTTHRTCRVLMDLAGPKVRTGPLEAGPSVVKVRPLRDPFGNVTRPARVWFSPQDAPRPSPTAADACLRLPKAVLTTLAVGDRLIFTDARKSKRTLTVAAVSPDGCWAEADRTSYLTPGLPLRIERDGADIDVDASIEGIAPQESAIRLATGDRLILTREMTPGRPSECDSAGRVLNPATIACTSEQVFEDARAWRACVDRRRPDRRRDRATNRRPPAHPDHAHTGARSEACGRQGHQSAGQRAASGRHDGEGSGGPDIRLRQRRYGGAVVRQFG